MLTTMGKTGFCFCFILFIQVNLITGQSLPQEELLNITTCTLNSVNLNCSNDDMIAFQSAHFYYHATCESTCCQYSSEHDTVGASQEDITDIRRQCSGQNICSLDVHGVRTFVSGVKPPSYAILYYHCIPKSRTASICSNDKLPSGGSLLYLTNEGFPSVTTDHRSCSCSLEVYSCASGVNMYLVDTDMYLDIDNCQQGIDVIDGKNASLFEITCASYYTNEISTSSFNTNFIRIDFTDNSDANQEGIFFIGFGAENWSKYTTTDMFRYVRSAFSKNIATEPNVAFKLSCSAEPQTTCIDCGTPNSVPNGEITLDNGNTSSGSLATVSCSNGYETNNATLICLETGQWTNTTCSPKDCGEPYTIPNGTVKAAVDGSTTFGAKANVTCDPGYQMTGYCNHSTEFQCGDGTCIDMDKRCDSFPHCPNELDELLCPNVISCPEGQKLCDVTCVNEQVTCEESETSVVETDAGTISCLVIGTWEKVKCSAKDCGTPIDIENGTISLTEDGRTTYMSTADVTCDTGFSPSITLISCQADGSWENGECNINDCGVPTVPNGTVTLTKPGESTVGSTADIECSAGFTFSVSSITCLTSGQWENASCDINDCGGLDSIANGTLQLKIEGRTTYGSTATVSCVTGFSPSVTEITCTANGEWDNATCMINDCRDLDPIKNGTLQLTTEGKTTYGSTATVTCDTGFTSSQTQINCQANSEWENATCKIKDCSGLDSIANGTLQLKTEGITTYGSTATVSCETGFFPSVTDITCTENGEWENATCIIKDCRELDPVKNGTLQLTTEGKTTYGSTATVTCDTGFNPSQTQITCQANSEWDNATCKINDCGGLDTIANGTLQLKTAGKTTYDSTATVSCEAGFTPSVTEITCTAKGEWDNATCMIKDCRELDPIKNGTLQLTTEGKTTYGSTATVTCETGFNPSPTQIICQANGEWENATCMINDCGELAPIKNGTLQLTTEGKTTYGSTATVTCDTGFTPSQTQINCQANSEWENATCKINDCSGLYSIANGTLQLTTKGKTTYGSTATVLCETGFTPSVTEITCTANEEWENATCKINDCGEQASITNGTLQLTTEGKTTYGSTATVTCETGFTPSTTQIICQANSEWENATCNIIDCERLDSIANGSLQINTEGKTTYGSTANVSCETGFTPSVTEITCTANGNWENATCMINDCGELASIKNGTFQLTIEGKTTYGSTATVTCETGFIPSRTSISCQANSQWENVTCSINDCGMPTTISNGTITLDGMSTYLSTATVLCESGYHATRESIICQANGTWTTAFCVLTDCGKPDEIENGIITLKKEDNTDFVSKAVVQCDTGFTPSDEIVLCMENGTWETAFCIINDCGKPVSIDNGTLKLGTENKTTYGSIATVTCETGFTPSRSSTSCQANSQWENVICNINDCDEPASIDNGTLKLGTENKTTYGSTATVTCETGFTPTSTSISCQANSLWENVVCNVNDCAKPAPIDNGTLQLETENKTTYGSIATVICETGFTPSRTSIYCQANSQWENVICNINDCDEPASIDNGTMKLGTENKTTYGSTATVLCETGFSPTSTSISCQANSQWEDVACNVNDCNEPAPINNGTLKLGTENKTTYGSTATVTCETGFTPTRATISCQENSQWENALCNINDCNEPAPINNGTLKLGIENKTTYGSTATVMCENGFSPSRASVSCQANRQWENVTCNINDCGEPDHIDNGTLLLATKNKTTYGSTATVTCETGFIPSRTSIICRANSQWENVACNINDCEMPATISNGNITLDSLTTYRSTATVSCESGYHATRESIICQANGTWTTAFCVLTDCGKPDEIENGIITLKKEDSTDFVSKAVVLCDTGFTPSDEIILCMENGTWETAFCQINVCGSLPTLDNGQISLPENKPAYIGVTAMVSCNTGYKHSSSSIRCLPSGQWQNATCDIINCGDPPTIEHGNVTILEGSFTTYDSVAQVICHKGYKPKERLVACTETGVWEICSCVKIDQEIFIILTAVGGAVLLIAILILAILIMWDKTGITSANLHAKRKHSPNLRTHTEVNRGSLQRINSYPIQEELFECSPNPTFKPTPYDIPMDEHVMFPNQIAELENNVLSKHEPHAWHSDMPNSSWNFNHGYRF